MRPLERRTTARSRSSDGSPSWSSPSGRQTRSAQQQIHGVDTFTGESHDAEQALDDAGLRPNEEVVLVQSDELTIDDPEFQAAVERR